MARGILRGGELKISTKNGMELWNEEMEGKGKTRAKHVRVRV